MGVGRWRTSGNKKANQQGGTLHGMTPPPPLEAQGRAGRGKLCVDAAVGIGVGIDRDTGLEVYVYVNFGMPLPPRRTCCTLESHPPTHPPPYPGHSRLDQG